VSVEIVARNLIETKRDVTHMQVASPKELCNNRMSHESEQHHQVDGTVLETVPNDLFRVRLVDGRHVLAHIGDDARVGIVRLIPGDRVVLELAALDPSRGRIVARAEGRKHESIGLG
jgi:translation initiation factor IF-1